MSQKCHNDTMSECHNGTMEQRGNHTLRGTRQLIKYRMGVIHDDSSGKFRFYNHERGTSRKMLKLRAVGIGYIRLLLWRL